MLRRLISVVILTSIVSLQILPYMPASIINIPVVKTLSKSSLLYPSSVDAVGISSASATLTNPRLSFHGLVGTLIPIGAISGDVKASGIGGDYNTQNLFPLDSLKISANAAIDVASISGNLTFTLKTPLVSAGAADSNMTVAQGGTLKVRIFTASDIPVGGSIKVTVPAPNQLVALTTDGISLSETSLANSGFDTNGMTNANVACPGSFAAGTFTAGASGAPHTFTCNYSGGAALLAGTPLTISIGDNTKPLINPAPVSAAHTVGVADVYAIKAETFTGTNGGGSLLQDGFMKVAPVEGVLVSASVDETLSFTVAGLNAGTYCGVAATVATTATSVPWGTLNAIYAVGTNNAAQLLTVSTNASSGYTVYAEENDQMGKEGNVCTGTAPSTEPYLYTLGRCIRDYNKGGASSTTAIDWTAAPGTDYGFGYSLQPVSAGCISTSCTRFTYNTGGTYMAKRFADQEGTEDKYATNADIMYGTSPVDTDSARVCYRIHIPGTQPAGYYYNKLKFTAVAKF